MNTVETMRRLLAHPEPKSASERKSFRLTRRTWMIGIGLGFGALAVACLMTSGGSATVKRLFGAASTGDVLTYQTRYMDLEITVLASGMLESASTKEVVSEVEGEVSVISLLDRGTPVRRGDIVVELDSSELKKNLLQQRVTVQQSKAATAQAQEALDVAKSQAESDISAARLALKFAQLDHRKYVDGDYPQQRRSVLSEIMLAEEDLKRATERLNYASELRELGYLSKGQLDADRLVLLRSEEALKLAKEKLRLLEEFTYKRQLEDLQAQIEAAERGLARAESLAQSVVEQAQARLKAAQAMEELEAAKLVHLEDQIAKCTLRAPQDGVVLYPMPEDEDEVIIKQGAMVRQRQHVFTIPSTDRMQVSASVHEASVHLIEPGKIARIWVDSFPDRQLAGTAKEVSSLPDLQSWRKSTVNFYPAKILIEGDVGQLRPGMNAKVEIVIDQMAHVLAVPVQSIVRTEEASYCIVLESGRPVAREIALGRANAEYVEVKRGLDEGELVVLSPDETGVEIPEAKEG